MRAPRAVWLLLVLFLAAAFVGPSLASGATKKKKKEAAAKEAPVNFDKTLPVLGTKLAEFPAGPTKALADASCLTCHSADIVVQQHLTEKQWAASVTKMAGWGAPVPEDKRSELVAYLVEHFGPDNTHWQPVVARPSGR